jgi:hypothetical protein
MYNDYFVIYKIISQADGTLDFSKIITSIVAVVNLLIVIYIYVSTKRHNSIIRDAEKKAVWYRELIIKPHSVALEKLYTDLKGTFEVHKNLIINLIQNDQMKEVDIEIGKLIRSLKSTIEEFEFFFVDVVNSIDSEFAKKLYTMLDDLADRMISIAESIKNVDEFKDEHIEILRLHRVKLLKNLYDYHFL